MLESLIISILGAALPVSDVHVPVAVTPVYHSVQFFDNQIDLTNRVLARTVRADVVRVQTDAHTQEIYADKAKKQQAAAEEHCQKRLDADSIPNSTTECGPGFKPTIAH